MMMKKKKKKKAKEHACDCCFLHSHHIITSQQLTYCQTFEKPILSKEQHFVALRQQGSLQSRFYMQANNPSIGLEKYYFSYSSTNTTKLIHTTDKLLIAGKVKRAVSLIMICSFQILQCYDCSIWKHFKQLNTGPAEDNDHPDRCALTG